MQPNGVIFTHTVTMGNGLSDEHRPERSASVRKLHATTDRVTATGGGGGGGGGGDDHAQHIGVDLQNLQDDDGFIRHVTFDHGMVEQAVDATLVIMINVNPLVVALSDGIVQMRKAQLVAQFAAIRNVLSAPGTVKVAVRFNFVDNRRFFDMDLEVGEWKAPVLAFLTAFWNNKFLLKKLAIVNVADRFDTNFRSDILDLLKSVPMETFVQFRLKDRQQGRPISRLERLDIDLSLIDDEGTAFTDWLLNAELSPMRIFPVVQFVGTDPRFYKIMARVLPRITALRQATPLQNAIAKWSVREVRIIIGNMNDHFFMPPIDDLEDDELWQLERSARRNHLNKQKRTSFRRNPTPKPASWEVNIFGVVKSLYLQEFVRDRSKELKTFKNAFNKLLSGVNKPTQFADNAKVTILEFSDGTLGEPQTDGEQYQTWTNFPETHFVAIAATHWSNLGLQHAELKTTVSSLKTKIGKMSTSSRFFGWLSRVFFPTIVQTTNAIDSLVDREYDYLEDFNALENAAEFQTLSNRKTDTLSAAVDLLNNVRICNDLLPTASNDLQNRKGAFDKSDKVTNFSNVRVLESNLPDKIDTINEFVFNGNQVLAGHLARIGDFDTIADAMGADTMRLLAPLNVKPILKMLAKLAANIGQIIDGGLEVNDGERNFKIHLRLTRKRDYLVKSAIVLFIIRKSMWKIINTTKELLIAVGQDLPEELVTLVQLENDNTAIQLVGADTSQNTANVELDEVTLSLAACAMFE
jgi:hypothetical protein